MYVQGQGLLESGVRDGCMVIMVISIPLFALGIGRIATPRNATCLSGYACIFLRGMV